MQKKTNNNAYKTKICLCCGKEYECIDKGGKSRFCSKACQDLNYSRTPKLREYQKKYREQNNEQIKQIKKQCYENKREYYIKKSKENSENNPNTPFRRFKSLSYKGKRLTFKFDVRCGVCNLCRAVEKIDTYSTQRHHDNDIYFDNDPLKNTLEICVNCHGIETFNKVRPIKNVQKKINKKEK